MMSKHANICEPCKIITCIITPEVRFSDLRQLRLDSFEDIFDNSEHRFSILLNLTFYQNIETHTSSNECTTYVPGQKHGQTSECRIELLLDPCTSRRKYATIIPACRTWNVT